MAEKRNLLEQLNDFLTEAARVAIVGVGQEWRSDDAVGIAVVESLYKELSGSFRLPLSLCEREFVTGTGPVKIFSGFETPEKLTSQLRQFGPTHAIFVDAAQLDKPPGEIELIMPSDIVGDEVSTHDLPLSVLAEFLLLDIGCRSALLGIQPASLEFNENMELAPEVAAASAVVAESLTAVLGKA